MNIEDYIGRAIRKARMDKLLSQGDLEKVTGMLRCYLSRVENGHTVPSLGTLQVLCTGLGIKVSELLVLAEAEMVLTEYAQSLRSYATPVTSGNAEITSPWHGHTA